MSETYKIRCFNPCFGRRLLQLKVKELRKRVEYMGFNPCFGRRLLQLYAFESEDGVAANMFQSLFWQTAFATGIDDRMPSSNSSGFNPCFGRRLLQRDDILSEKFNSSNSFNPCFGRRLLQPLAKRGPYSMILKFQSLFWQTAFATKGGKKMEVKVSYRVSILVLVDGFCNLHA